MIPVGNKQSEKQCAYSRPLTDREHGGYNMGLCMELKYSCPRSFKKFEQFLTRLFVPYKR